MGFMIDTGLAVFPNSSQTFGSIFVLLFVAANRLRRELKIKRFAALGDNRWLAREYSTFAVHPGQAS